MTFHLDLGLLEFELVPDFTANPFLEFAFVLTQCSRQVWEWTGVVSCMLEWVPSMIEAIGPAIGSRALNVTLHRSCVLGTWGRFSSQTILDVQHWVLWLECFDGYYNALRILCVSGKKKMNSWTHNIPECILISIKTLQTQQAVLNTKHSLGKKTSSST